MARLKSFAPDEFDARDLRDVLGSFATGVTVVTSCGDGGAPVGLVVNSFSSVSLEPPQILWSLALSSPSRGAFCTHPGFAVNVMGAGSKESTLRFARPSDNKFQDVRWRPGLHGVPVLDDAVATLECETEKRIESGDHEIFIGRVVRIDAREGDPLIFHRGQFAQIGRAL